MFAGWCSNYLGMRMPGLWGMTGFLIGLIFLVVAIAATVALVVWIVKRSNGTTANRKMEQDAQTSLALLEERYARGEITRDEFLSMKDDLRSR